MCEHENAEVVWSDKWSNYFVCPCGDEYWGYKHENDSNEMTKTRGL